MGVEELSDAIRAAERYPSLAAEVEAARGLRERWRKRAEAQVCFGSSLPACASLWGRWRKWTGAQAIAAGQAAQLGRHLQLPGINAVSFHAQRSFHCDWHAPCRPILMRRLSGCQALPPLSCWRASRGQHPRLTKASLLEAEHARQRARLPQPWCVAAGGLHAIERRPRGMPQHGPKSDSSAASFKSTCGKSTAYLLQCAPPASFADAFWRELNERTQQLEDATEQARQVRLIATRFQKDCDSETDVGEQIGNWRGLPSAVQFTCLPHSPQAAGSSSDCPLTSLPCLQANIAVAKAKRVLKELQAQVGIADALLSLQARLVFMAVLRGWLLHWAHELQFGITKACQLTGRLPTVEAAARLDEALAQTLHPPCS